MPDGVRARRFLLLACCAAAPPRARGASAALSLPRLDRHELPPLATVISCDGRRGRGRERGRGASFTLLRRDDRPYRMQRGAPCTQLLLVANVATYALQLLTMGRLTAAGCKPARAFRLQDWPRLFTPVFLHGDARRARAASGAGWRPLRWWSARSHACRALRRAPRRAPLATFAGSIPHLLVNSYSLNDLGTVVERSFGTNRFALTYALAGVAGNAASFALNAGVTSVGASGAICGLVGAYAAYLAANRNVLGQGSGQELESLGIMIGLNLAFGFVSPGIDNCGHIGGLLGGAATGWLLGPRLFVAWSPLNPLQPIVMVDRSPWPALTRALDRVRGRR